MIKRFFIIKRLLLIELLHLLNAIDFLIIKRYIVILILDAIVAFIDNFTTQNGFLTTYLIPVIELENYLARF